MSDSPRWCDACKTWADHHTDRCPHWAPRAEVERLRAENEALRQLDPRQQAYPDPLSTPVEDGAA